MNLNEYLDSAFKLRPIPVSELFLLLKEKYRKSLYRVFALLQGS